MLIGTGATATGSSGAVAEGEAERSAGEGSEYSSAPAMPRQTAKTSPVTAAAGNSQRFFEEGAGGTVTDSVLSFAVPLGTAEPFPA